MAILSDQNAHTHPPTGRRRNHHKRHSRTSTQMSIETNGKGRSKNSHPDPDTGKQKHTHKTQKTSKISKIDTIIKKSSKKHKKTKRKSKCTSYQCQFTHKSRFQSKFRHRNQNITQNLKSESKVTHRNTVLSKTIGDFSINRQINAINKSSVPNHNKRPETQTTTDIQRRMQCQT